MGVRPEPLTNWQQNLLAIFKKKGLRKIIGSICESGMWQWRKKTENRMQLTKTFDLLSLLGYRDRASPNKAMSSDYGEYLLTRS